MKVQTEIPNVRKELIEISKNSRVSQLKQKICEKYAIEEELTNLLLNGKILTENEKIKDLKILSGSVVIVDYFWARQYLLWGKKGQSVLQNSTVFVAGAGAIGNEVLADVAVEWRETAYGKCAH